MIIVFFIVLIVVLISLIIFFYNKTDSKKIIFLKEQELLLLKDRYKIAEKKFLQGKIKQNIFDKLKNDLEYEIVLIELEIFRVKKNYFSKLEEKFQQILLKIKKPTKYKKAKLKGFLKESEMIRNELRLIEKKILKNEISQNTFERLLQEKEKEMIKKETQILHFLKNQEE